MRILYALALYRPSIDGITISIERQALGLVDRGHEVAIVAPGESLQDYEEEHQGIRVFRLKAVSLLSSRWRVAVFPEKGVEHALEEFQPDVVVVSHPFLHNRSTGKLALRQGYPVVGITGVMPEWFFYNLGILRPIDSMLNGAISDHIWKMITDYYNLCDFVVGVTPTALDYLKQHGLNRPSTVISNGVQLDRFHPRPRDIELAERLGVPDKPTVLYTGRVDAEKRLDVWLEAAAKVRQHVDAHFIIGGDGTERSELESLARELGIAEHVTFPGFLDDNDYAHIYSLANVFAIASPAELQSIVTLEAAASGLPLVAVNAGALPELCHDGENGFLFTPSDREELAGHLVRLLTQPELRRQMGEESLRIAAKHDIRNTILAYEDVYETVVRTSSQTAA